jgi:hypothetical protein
MAYTRATDQITVRNLQKRGDAHVRREDLRLGVRDCCSLTERTFGQDWRTRKISESGSVALDRLLMATSKLIFRVLLPPPRSRR